MLWIRVWHWWFELVAVAVIALACLVMYLGKPSGYELDMTGLLLMGIVLVFVAALLFSSYRKYRQQVGSAK
jgi:type IV secretory pathway VirB2 component (pilin)